MSADPELEKIAAIETLEDAVGYLVSRGMPRESAARFVQALLDTPDDPAWPRKDH